MLEVNRRGNVRNLCIVLSNREHWNCLWKKSARLRNGMGSLVSDYKSLKSEEAYHISLNYQTGRFSITLSGFVDQLSAPGASFSALTSSPFPSLTDFNAAATADALKWVNLEQNVVYQIVSTRTFNTQHGQSVILSLQKADGSSCSVWACGMLTNELLQNPMMMLFVLSPGPKMSKIGRVYNSYQLLHC